MRIAVATDTWHPQRNGVVRVLDSVLQRLRAQDHEVCLISPERFRTIPCPSYPEIPLALWPQRRTERLLREFAPEAIHIATEGPIGRATRAVCLAAQWPFTTAYHTKFPEYMADRTRLPVSWFHAMVRSFHRPSAGVLVPAPAVFRELEALDYASLRQWSHGVDTDLFRPAAKGYLDNDHLVRPIFMYIGRLAPEKTLPAFLDLDLPGSKVVVGDGPARRDLMQRYPGVLFRVANGDQELVCYYNAADAFVFPSRTDTFGLVMLEALACGVPVAGFPVSGPIDVIGRSGAGVLEHDLRMAALAALKIPAEVCRARALALSWDRVADEFLSYLAPIATMRP